MGIDAFRGLNRVYVGENHLMAIPDFQMIMLPLLDAVKSESIPVRRAVEAVSKHFSLSDEECEETIPSGKQILISNRTQWAATYLVKAGLLERPERGILKITAEGLIALNSKPSRIDIEYLGKYESFRNFRERPQANNNNEETKISEETPEDLIATAYKKYAETTKDELLDLILRSSPTFFEHLIIDLFKAMGYGGRGKSTHVGKSGDGGIDGVINEDPLGLEKIYLQAKRYAPEHKIQIDQLRSFCGTLAEQGADKGIFVTTSSFVGSAREYVQRVPQSMVLIDGQELTRLLYEYDVGVRTAETIKLKKPDLDYFEEV
jgi:restriction system protein